MGTLRATTTLGLLGVTFLGVLALLPIAVLVIMSFNSSPGLGSGELTLANYQTVFRSSLTAATMKDTLIFLAGSSVVAVSLGMLLAWLVSSVDTPWKSALRLLPLATLLLGLVKDISWPVLFSPQTGLVNIGLSRVLGLEHPAFNVFSMTGLVVLVGLSGAAVTYSVLLAPFESVDDSLSEASRMSGTGPIRTWFRVVLPVVAPALLSALALNVILVANTFEAAVIIGLPAGISTYASVIFEEIGSRGPSEYNVAAAQSSLYLILTGSVLVAYLFATRREARFAVVGGAHRHSLLRAPLLRGIALFVIVGYFAFTFVLPVGVTALVSAIPYYTVTQGNPFATFTFDNYRRIFARNDVLGAMTTSGILSLAVVIGASFAGGLLAWVAVRTQSRFRRVADIISVAPIAAPPIVLSVAVLMTVVSLPGPVRLVYGTAVPMFVALIVVFMPFAARILSSALIQLREELIEASAIAGISPIHTARLIVLPLMKPALLYSAALLFLLSYRELAAAILLVNANTVVIPYVTFESWLNGGYTEVAALNMVTLLIPLVFGAAIALLAGRGRRPTANLSVIPSTVSAGVAPAVQ